MTATKPDAAQGSPSNMPVESRRRMGFGGGTTLRETVLQPWLPKTLPLSMPAHRAPGRRG